MKHLLTLAVLALSVGAATPAALAVSEPHHPINVTACRPTRNVMPARGFVPAYYPPNLFYWNTVYGYRYYQPPVRTSAPSLAIDYTNATDKTMKEIEFGLVANGNLVAEVKDVGTFSPGAEIKHEFGISHDVFPLRTALSRCVPLRVTYEDGTKWRNPRLPHMMHKLGQ